MRLTGGREDSTLWKFVRHIVYDIKLTMNFLKLENHDIGDVE